MEHGRPAREVHSGGRVVGMEGAVEGLFIGAERRWRRGATVVADGQLGAAARFMAAVQMTGRLGCSENGLSCHISI